LGWAVLLTQPNRERTALTHVERQGFTAWLPRVRSVVVRRGLKVEAVEPLFPRYLLVQIVDAWHCLLSTTGVSGLLRDGDQPAFIRQNEFDALRARELDGLVVLDASPPRFVRGDAVRIGEGPFAGHRAIFDGMTGLERCCALFSLCGRQVRVRNLSEEALEAA
jgi:transcriptional antiterminator RfaH